MVSKRVSEAIWVESKGYWQVKVQRDGVRKAFTSAIKGRRGKHAAENKADEWLAKGTDDMRFPAAWEQFLEDQKQRTGTANYQKHEVAGRLRILPAIGSAKLSSITPNDWQRCIDKGAKDGLSRRSCKNIEGSISAFIHYAERNRWTVNRLLPGELKIPNSAAPKKPKKILQPDDVRTLFTQDQILKSGRYVRAHYIYAWRFLVVTGLRRGELAGLRREDIEGQLLTIRRSINAFQEETYGKNDNARRTIVLSPIALDILADQCRHLKDLGLASPWVFPDEYGERAVPTSIYDRWRFYCNQHGFKTSIHELRHTFVSLNKSLPVEAMKAYVGHSTSMDTYGIYGHDVDGEARRTATIVGNTFDVILNSKK